MLNKMVFLVLYTTEKEISKVFLKNDTNHAFVSSVGLKEKN